MTDNDLNPFAAPGSNTSPDEATIGFRDLFKGSLASVFDGADGALLTGLRITLVALLWNLVFTLMQSLFMMAAAPSGPFGADFSAS